MVNVKVDASLFMFLAQCVHFFSPQKFPPPPVFPPQQGIAVSKGDDLPM